MIVEWRRAAGALAEDTSGVVGQHCGIIGAAPEKCALLVGAIEWHFLKDT